MCTIRQTSAIFLTAQKKNKTVHFNHSNLLYLALMSSTRHNKLAFPFNGVISEVWDPLTEVGRPTTAHGTCILASRLVFFGCGVKIQRLRPKQPPKPVSQVFFSQFSVFEPSNMLYSEVWCPLAIAIVPRSTRVTCIPANQCHFPPSAKIKWNSPFQPLKVTISCLDE